MSGETVTKNILPSPAENIEIDRQIELIRRGVVDLLPLDEFRAMLLQSLRTGVPLRIKQGFDPTSPDIHIGHAVGIRKLRQLQLLGHTIVLIVGDYTSLIGDPSGRSSTRPTLSYDEIMSNAKTYQEQFFRILDKDRVEVRFNGEWFKTMPFDEVVKLAAKFTLSQILERDDFTKRYKAGVPISLHEFLYPLMQGYDSYAIRADLELGATEQTFNLLAGRVIQESYGQRPQCILTMPILVGLDGEKKMSKSLGNYIGVTDDPTNMFGKVMSIPDSLIEQYYELCTDVSLEQLADIKVRLKDASLNPMLLKKELGEAIVDLYHPTGSGRSAREEFERVFAKGELPEDIPELSREKIIELGLDPSKLYLAGLIAKSGLAKSSTEARKLIASGAVTLGDQRIDDQAIEISLQNDVILKVGKRRYLKLTV